MVGAGDMGWEYYKVLQDLKCDVTVVGRGEEKLARFGAQASGNRSVAGGIESFLDRNRDPFDHAIVAVGVRELAPVTMRLLDAGFRSILLEKPGGLNELELVALAGRATVASASVFIAYNRRHYESVQEAKRRIADDGGLLSMHFEFTEWTHMIEPLPVAAEVKRQWLFGNSSHVLDLAFHFGGIPSELACYANPGVTWHDNAVFSGGGRTDQGVLFSYHANWLSAGRWGLELLTRESRLILRPLEELRVQKRGTLEAVKLAIDNAFDVRYKPGLFLQTRRFLLGESADLIDVAKQARMGMIYAQIASGKGPNAV
jgi:predicted dehydrogenase